MKNSQAIAAKGDSPMRELSTGWEINRTINTEHLRAALAEIELLTQEIDHENPN